MGLGQSRSWLVKIRAKVGSGIRDQGVDKAWAGLTCIYLRVPRVQVHWWEKLTSVLARS